MNSDLPKVLHRLKGRTLLDHVLKTAREVNPDRLIAVIGHRRDEVAKELAKTSTEWVIQDPQLGTGHAVQQTKDRFKKFQGEIIVLSGDVPLLKATTLRRLVEAHRQSAAAATVLSTKTADPGSYGRVIRSKAGDFERIVEAREASDEEKAVCEINSGIYCFRAEPLFWALEQVKPDNSKGEYYLTDVIGILKANGREVQAFDIAEFKEVRGINTKLELDAAELEIA